MHNEGLQKKDVKYQIVTHSPDDVDKHVILGVNEKEINKDKHFSISSSICDANAFGPAIHNLNEEYGIENGFLTTLHPWLAYQNLLDGPSRSFAYPGHIHENFTLGRNSLNALIPKTTSCVKASEYVLPYLEEKISKHVVPGTDVDRLIGRCFRSAYPKSHTDDVIAMFREKGEKQRFLIFTTTLNP